MPNKSAVTVVVLGSLTVDHILHAGRLPSPGETVTARFHEKRFGGNGANQALAASRFGAKVTLIGCLGDDVDGSDYRNFLRREGVNCSAINIVKGSTGNSFKVKARQNSYSIVDSGANASMTVPYLRMQRSRIEVAKALLLQLEVPLEVVVEAIKLANGRGVPVIFNPSCSCPGFPWGRVSVSVLILEEINAREIFEAEIADLANDPDAWRTRLNEKGLRALIVICDLKATLVFIEDGQTTVASYEIKLQNSEGRVDIFVAAITTRLAEGISILDSARWAAAAQEPSESEVERAMCDG